MSLGVLKELVRFRGIASTSSRESFLVSCECLEGALPASSGFSVSGPSLSEASPKRALRSMDARVGLGADKLLVRDKTWDALEPFPSSFWRGTVYFLELEWVLFS